MKHGDAAALGWLQWASPRLLLRAWAFALGLLLPMFTPAWATPAAATPVSRPSHTVLVLGDSLSAGYGLADVSKGWVALTAQRMAASKPDWNVVNASISGDTTAGGRARVVHELVLRRPAVVIIELGANDGLRGLPLRETRANLAYMIGASKALGATVLLVGMRLPPNYGEAYTDEFEQGYRTVAKRFGAALLPFLLAPIMTDPGAFQADNMHPVARVQPLLRDHVWTALAPLLHQPASSG